MQVLFTVAAHKVGIIVAVYAEPWAVGLSHRCVEDRRPIEQSDVQAWERGHDGPCKPEIRDVEIENRALIERISVRNHGQITRGWFRSCSGVGRSVWNDLLVCAT